MMQLSDLPKNVQAALRGLTREQFKDLADFAHIERLLEAERALPSEPMAAIDGIFETLRTEPDEATECAQETIINLLAVLRLVLSSGESDGIDAADCYPLWELATRAHNLALHSRQQRFSAMERCRRVLFADKHSGTSPRKE